MSPKGCLPCRMQHAGSNVLGEKKIKTIAVFVRCFFVRQKPAFEDLLLLTTTTQVKKNMIATVNSTVLHFMAIDVILPLWHNLAGC